MIEVDPCPCGDCEANVYIKGQSPICGCEALAEWNLRHPELYQVPR